MEYNKDLARELRKFLKSDKFIQRDYEMYDEFFGNGVLCRVFRYEPEDIITPILGADGKPLVNEKRRRVIPIAKVIKKAKDCDLPVEPGDLVALSDDLIGFQDNPAFLQFMIETNGEMSKGLEAVKPAATVNNFILWRKQYGFVGDKIKENDSFDVDDYFTFIFPVNFIKGKINIKKFDQWLGGME